VNKRIKPEEKQLQTELARKIVLKEADQAQINDFCALQVRYNKSCDDIQWEARLCLVQHYLNLSWNIRHAISKPPADSAEKVRELREFLNQNGIPLTVKVLERSYATGQPVKHQQGSHATGGPRSGQVQSKRTGCFGNDSTERIKLSLLLVRGEAVEADVQRFVELYQQRSVTLAPGSARHVAAVYLATRLSYIKPIASGSRSPVDTDREAIEYEAQTIGKALTDHCQTVSRSTIINKRMFLPGAVNVPAGGSEAASFDQDFQGSGGVSGDQGVDNMSVFTAEWDGSFDLDAIFSEY